VADGAPDGRRSGIAVGRAGVADLDADCLGDAAAHAREPFAFQGQRWLADVAPHLFCRVNWPWRVMRRYDELLAQRQGAPSSADANATEPAAASIPAQASFAF